MPGLNLRGDWEERLCCHLLPNGHPVNLAIFRILIFGGVLVWLDLDQLQFFASLPTELQQPPLGSDWLLSVLPIAPRIVTVAAFILIVSATAACLGYRTRISAWTAVGVGFYVLLVPQVAGKVNHYHHLLWFCAILAAAPSGDALSVDRYRKDHSLGCGDSYHPQYGVPLLLVWVLLGIIYLFPGWAKLMAGGFNLDWALSDNLRFFMYREWHDQMAEPSVFRVDRVPWLYRSAGVAVILFEVSFIALVLHRKTRNWVAAGGLLFHNLAGLTMGIWFWSLQLAYATFVDWRKHLTNCLPLGVTEQPSSTETWPYQPRKTVMAVGAILIWGNVVFATLGVGQGWPFALYPTFAEIKDDPFVRTMQVEKVGQDSTKSVDLSELKKRWGEVRFEYAVRSIARMRETEIQKKRLEALGGVIATNEQLTYGDSVRFYSVLVSTLPLSSHHEIRGQTLLAEVTVDR